MLHLHHLALAAPLLLSACAAPSGLVGSWQGDGELSERPFTFGTVSFVHDGTFTAEARYSDVIRVQTGHWVLNGTTLLLVEDQRQYELELRGDAAVFNDPTSGNAITLRRIP